MKNIRPYMMVAALFIAAICILFVKSGNLTGADKSSEDKNTKAQALKQKTPEIMMPLSVIVKEAAPPPKAPEIKKAPPEKKKAVKKSSAVKEAHAGDGKEKGGFAPNLVAEYEMPVKEYLLYMESKGGRVLVYDKVKDGFVCEIKGEGTLVAPSDISRMSHRSRRLTSDFPKSNEILAKVEASFGKGNYEILLLLPDNLEESIYENINRLIKKQGLNPEDVVAVFIEYRNSKSSIYVYVKKVTGSFGAHKIGDAFRL